MKKIETDKIPTNQALLNLITPIGGIEFSINNLQIGENTGRVYGIIKYPATVEMGWSSKICNIPGTIVSQTFTPVDNSALIEAISRNITQNRGIAESTKDVLTRQRAERGAEDGEKIIRQIDQNGETVGIMTIVIMPIARDNNVFQKTCRRVESIIAGQRCKVRGMANLQKQAYKALSPYYGTDETIDTILQRIVPMSKFIGGFPFSASGYNDGEGYYFAKDSSGGLIVLDPWKRGGDRTNTNWVIMGVPGVGKSTTIKHIILSEYMKGTKIIIIDPETEYKDLCYNLNGDWINAGGGKEGRINPLEIRPVPQDDEEDIDKLYSNIGMGNMALHMKTLEIFFSLYIPSLTDIQKALLKQILEELYNKFNIQWDTDITKLSSEDFPIFSDLYNLINEKLESNISSNEIEEYKVLSCLLRDIAVGADRFLWNGYTTVQTRSRCICMDTHDLQNASETIKKTQYFNLLTYCWEQMSKDRSEKVLLVCDEAYLMIDHQVPQSLVFLRNVAKRDRKYESAIAIISHSVVDFLAPEIKSYGQALLDNPCFKVLMGCDGKNLKETTELYNLTEVEQELLFRRKRGNALLMIGAKRLHAIFEIPDYEIEYMGKGGGR